MTEKQRKQRIAELRAELKELQATPKSDWHTAFEALLRFTTHKYTGVTIQTEVEIGADAPRTDYLILTGEETQAFEETIFHLFRRINIIEYKNPHDALNERVIYKIIGYANLLIGTAEREGDVPANQVTLSIFRAKKNPKLFREMEEAGQLVKTGVPGIYRVAGITLLPFQIVITGELKGNEYAACRALTDKAQEADVERVIENGSNEQDDMIREYYRIFLNLLAKKNPEVFDEIRRDDEMKYPYLMKVVEDEVKQERRAQEQETTVTYIHNIMESLGLTVEKAMEFLKIPPTQRETYAGLVQKKL